MHPNHLGSLKKHRCLDSPLGQLSPILRAGGRTPELFKSFLIESNVQPGLGTIVQNNPQSPPLLSLSRSPQARCEFAHHPWGEGYAGGWTVRVFTSSVGGTGWLIENPQFLAWGGCAIYNTAVPSAGNGTSNSCGRFSERIGYTPRAREFKWTSSPAHPAPSMLNPFRHPWRESSSAFAPLQMQASWTIINNYILLFGLQFQIVVIQENPIMTVALRSFFQAKQNICLDIFLIGKCFLCWVLSKLNFSLDRGGSCHSITHLWKLHPSLSPGALKIFPCWLGCTRP